MNEFIPKPSEEKAEFNNAFAFLERLNQIEYMIESNLMQWKLNDAFSILESYENELCFSFKGDNQKDIDTIKKKIVIIFNANPKLGKVGRDATGRRYIIGGATNGELRSHLIELNQTLRQIKHKRGMGMPTKGEGKLF